MQSLNHWNRRVAASMLFVLLGSPAVLSAQYAQPAGPPPGYGAPGGWDAPPSEYSEIQRKGFQQGIEGARKDYENHRAPNVNNRDEFRHPNVPRQFRADYRAAFQRGYELGVQHMMGR